MMGSRLVTMFWVFMLINLSCCVFVCQHLIILGFRVSLLLADCTHLLQKLFDQPSIVKACFQHALLIHKGHHQTPLDSCPCPA